MSDASPFAEVAAAASLEEAAARLGALLEMDGPAPLAATRRALEDPQFARALMGVRKLPDVRDRLLAGVIRVAPATGGTPAPPPRSETPTAAQSIVKAAGALLKWGMDGLKPAQPWVIERRLAACAACEFQAPAPDTLIYRGAKVVAGKDAKICTVCHCLTNTKAAISTEQCPERDPERPGLSRWGEAWVKPSDQPSDLWS